MFSDVFQLSGMFQGREGCSGHTLTGSAGPGAQDNLMACTLWMPAEQGMPNWALAIGRSFRLWFIILSNCNRMGGKTRTKWKKLFRRGTLSLTEWRNGTPLNSPFVRQFVSQQAERINAMNTELRMRAATGVQPSVQHSTSCCCCHVKLRKNWEAHLQILQQEQKEHLPLPGLLAARTTRGLCLHQQKVNFQPEKEKKAPLRLLRERSLNPRPEALIIKDLCESCQISPCSVIRAAPRVCFVSQ